MIACYIVWIKKEEVANYIMRTLKANFSLREYLFQTASEGRGTCTNDPNPEKYVYQSVSEQPAANRCFKQY